MQHRKIGEVIEVSKIGMIDMFVGKKLEIKAGKEVKNNFLERRVTF